MILNQAPPRTCMPLLVQVAALLVLATVPSSEVAELRLLRLRLWVVAGGPRTVRRAGLVDVRACKALFLIVSGQNSQDSEILSVL